jgi:hypothetical protein
VSQHARSGGDVLAEQLVLEELGARRDRDEPPLAQLPALHREGDRGREVGQGLADPRAPLEQQHAPLREVAREATREADLLLADAIALEVASTPGLVREGGGDGVLVERHRGLRALLDLDVLELRCDGGLRELLLAEQRQPRRLRGEGLERPSRRAVARLAGPRARADARQHARGIERIRERPVVLLGLEEELHEGLEPKVRRVGMGEGEQVEGIEKRGLAERRIDATRQEVAVELRVVCHEGPPQEQPRRGRRDLAHPGCFGEVGRREPREPLHRRRRRPLRPHETARGAHPPLPRIEQHRTKLEQLRPPLLDQPRGLEIHHRQRPHLLHPGPQHLGLEPELPRLVILDAKRFESVHLSVLLGVKTPRWQGARAKAYERTPSALWVRLRAEPAGTTASLGYASLRAPSALALFSFRRGAARRRCRPCNLSPGG